MKPIVKRVKDYWKRQMPLLSIDTEVMSDCVVALTMEEQARISMWNGVSEPDDDLSFILSKVFNRHNDVCAGTTTIASDKGNYVVEITAQSSISELNISLKTLRDCNRACIYHVEDIDKEILPTLSFEAIAELTGAIIEADQVEPDTANRGRRVVVARKGNNSEEQPDGVSAAKE